MARVQKSSKPKASEKSGTADRIITDAADLMRRDPKKSATEALRELEVTERKAVRHYRPLLIAYVAEAGSPASTVALRATEAKKVASPEPRSAPVAKPQATAPVEAQPSSSAKSAPTPAKVDAAPPVRRASATKTKAAKPAPATLDPMALARPWLMLGLHATTSAIAMQTTMARLALNSPPVTQALRQGQQVASAMARLGPMAWWLPRKK